MIKNPSSPSWADSLQRAAKHLCLSDLRQRDHVSGCLLSSCLGSKVEAISAHSAVCTKTPLISYVNPWAWHPRKQKHLQGGGPENSLHKKKQWKAGLRNTSHAEHMDFHTRSSCWALGRAQCKLGNFRGIRWLSFLPNQPLYLYLGFKFWDIEVFKDIFQIIPLLWATWMVKYLCLSTGASSLSKYTYSSVWHLRGFSHYSTSSKNPTFFLHSWSSF